MFLDGHNFGENRNRVQRSHCFFEDLVMHKVQAESQASTSICKVLVWNLFVLLYLVLVFLVGTDNGSPLDYMHHAGY
jgi:hypothetical protein